MVSCSEGCSDCSLVIMSAQNSQECSYLGFSARTLTTLHLLCLASPPASYPVPCKAASPHWTHLKVLLHLSLQLKSCLYSHSEKICVSDGVSNSPPTQSKGSYSRLCRASSWGVNILSNGDSKTTLGICVNVWPPSQWRLFLYYVFKIFLIASSVIISSHCTSLRRVYTLPLNSCWQQLDLSFTLSSSSWEKQQQQFPWFFLYIICYRKAMTSLQCRM